MREFLDQKNDKLQLKTCGLFSHNVGRSVDVGNSEI